MNRIIMLIALLLSALTTNALAAGPYVGASGGVSFFHDQDIKYSSGSTSTSELKTGYGLNIGAGYNFDPVRIEAELGYKKADVDNFKSGNVISTGIGSDSRIASYMINAYYDFKNNSKFTPFAGIGLGALNGTFRSPGYESNDVVFGYQLIVGSSYDVTKHFGLDLSYRFQGGASDFKISGSEVSYMSSNIIAGLRYNF